MIAVATAIGVRTMLMPEKLIFRSSETCWTIPELNGKVKVTSVLAASAAGNAGLRVAVAPITVTPGGMPLCGLSVMPTATPAAEGKVSVVVVLVLTLRVSDAYGWLKEKVTEDSVAVPSSGGEMITDVGVTSAAVVLAAMSGPAGPTDIPGVTPCVFANKRTEGGSCVEGGPPSRVCAGPVVLRENCGVAPAPNGLVFGQLPMKETTVPVGT